MKDDLLRERLRRRAVVDPVLPIPVMQARVFQVLGPVKLFPVVPDVGRTFYQAETALQVLDLFGNLEGSSNWLRWWTQSQPIRTLVEIPLSFPIVDTRPPFPYQQLAEKASELRRLGVSACAIARALNVTDKTVSKALRFARETRRNPRKAVE